VAAVKGGVSYDGSDDGGSNGSTSINARLDNIMILLKNAQSEFGKFVTIQSCGVVDLLGGLTSKFTEIEHARALRNYLDSTPELVPSTIDAVFVERQPPQLPGKMQNRKATAVGNQLVFYYANHAPKYVSAGLKNKISLGPGYSLDDFGDNYAGRKKHTTAMLRRLAMLFGFEDKIIGIPAATLNNLADAFMQVFAFLILRS